jgi:GMP synthase (glutamine-hydrolysing)
MLDKIIILDFGSQTTQLIGRRLRELNEYCEIVPYNKFPAKTDDVKGVILSGSPFSVYDPTAFKTELGNIRGKYPVLGICYGAQFMAYQSGGKVEAAGSREYGRANLTEIDSSDDLFRGINPGSQIWMSHGDSITKIPDNFIKIASTSDVEMAAYKISGEKTWGVQFHPEVFHTLDGMLLLENFLKICECKRDWSPASFIDTTVKELKEQLGDDRVVLGLSGGVDSSVAAVLLHKAIGKNLSCIFVDHGLLRKNEFENVLKDYEHLGLNVIGVNAKEHFYSLLKGVSEPEKKRKIIGAGFIDVFDQEAHKIEDVKWLAQGTIYPDIIESLSITGTVIKSHHNVGGLPDKMKLKLCEPLRLLFKDEVRKVGYELGMMHHLIKRHPFPGPGLAVRILGDITEEKVRILQEADDIFINGLKEWNLYDKVWQAGVILLPVQSVGVMGDERTYENAVALRAVTSTDAMTADWAQLPYEFLAKISNEIINKVKGVNRVVYDISSKPPATIEWE